MAKGLVCFLQGVSGGASFLSASSSGFRLTLDIRPVELKAAIHSWWDRLGVATALVWSLVERAVGLVAFKGKDRENMCGFGLSAALGPGAYPEGSSVKLLPEVEVVRVLDKG